MPESDKPPLKRTKLPVELESLAAIEQEWPELDKALGLMDRDELLDLRSRLDDLETGIDHELRNRDD